MIDKSIIAQLTDDVGDELALELLNVYISESKKTITLMASSTNADEIEISAHSLKSSSYSFGAVALGDTCQKIEEYVKTPYSNDELTKLLQEAQSQAHNTFKALRAITQTMQT